MRFIVSITEAGSSTIALVRPILARGVAACRRRARIVVDGAFSRSDVVKAIALGADMVGIGRLYARAGCRSIDGIVRVLELLEAEITDVSMLGVNPAQRINASHSAKRTGLSATCIGVPSFDWPRMNIDDPAPSQHCREGTQNGQSRARHGAFSLNGGICSIATLYHKRR